MSVDYAKRRSHSRLNREEKKRALKTSLIFVIALGSFALLFGFLGINLLARLSLLISHLRAPKSTPITQDSIPPSAPQLISPGNATSSAVISLNGFAEPESQVFLYVNGTKSDKITVPESGEISFPKVVLTEGLNTLYAVAYDGIGNESARSASLTVIVDDTAPNLDITKPANGSVFYGSVERLVSIQGKTDPEVSLNLNDRIVLVNPDGTFSTQLELQEGNNLLRFTATDSAGNQTTQEISVSYSP